MATFREAAQQIRDRADVVEIIQTYVPLRRAGAQWKGLCPFHPEKTPSFNVNPSRQGWYCFGCHKGGSIIDFIMGVEKLEYREAVELLARRLNIELPSRDFGRDENASRAAKESERRREDLLNLNRWALEWFQKNLYEFPNSPVGAYLARRQVAPEMAAAFFLGASPDGWQALLDAARAKGFSDELLIEAGLIIHSESANRLYDRFRGRLMFPILDHRGRCLGFGGRIVVEDPEKKLPKYINSNETPVYQKGKNLYGIYQAQKAIELRGRAILVEGNLDCIMAHQGGFTEAVATLGTALTDDQARMLRRYCREVIFVYDGDEAGQKAMRRGGEILVKAGLSVKAAILPPEHDPDSLIRAEGPAGFARFVDSASDIYDYLLSLALARVERGEHPSARFGDGRHRAAPHGARGPARTQFAHSGGGETHRSGRPRDRGLFDAPRKAGRPDERFALGRFRARAVHAGRAGTGRSRPRRALGFRRSGAGRVSGCASPARRPAAARHHLPRIRPASRGGGG